MLCMINILLDFCQTLECNRAVLPCRRIVKTPTGHPLRIATLNACNFTTLVLVSRQIRAWQDKAIFVNFHWRTSWLREGFNVGTVIPIQVTRAALLHVVLSVPHDHDSCAVDLYTFQIPCKRLRRTIPRWVPCLLTKFQMNDLK